MAVVEIVSDIRLLWSAGEMESCSLQWVLQLQAQLMGGCRTLSCRLSSDLLGRVQDTQGSVVASQGGCRTLGTGFRVCRGQPALYGGKASFTERL